MKWAPAVAAIACLVLPVLAGPADAQACGGAFFETSPTVNVTDHRMAISIAKDQTIVWDQIQYQGDPREFAFVFPVPPGSRVELGDDAWLTALDAYTAPTIYSPRDSSHSGCALMGCAATENTSLGSASGAGQGPVTSLVVGPYLVSTVTPRSESELLSALAGDGLTVPSGAAPIVASYLAAGMSFVVMRLRPGCGERSIAPVRIVMPGSHATVPLRLASMGASQSVNVEIFVLGEQRWAPQSYPEGAVDFAKVRADYAGNNYPELAEAVFASAQGRTFITEFAGKATGVNVDQTDLASTFSALCAAVPSAPATSSCVALDYDASTISDAADPFFDAASTDASDNGASREAGADDAGGDGGDGGDDAGDDAGDGAAMMFKWPGASSIQNVTGNGPSAPRGTGTGITRTCGSPTDLARATEHTPYERLYITRLRAHIPVGQIAQADLTLRPSSDGDLSQYHQALATPSGEEPRSNPDATCRTGSGRARPRADVTAALAALAFLAAVVVRRRTRR
jgi:hypothetical protein